MIFTNTLLHERAAIDYISSLHVAPASLPFYANLYDVSFSFFLSLKLYVLSGKLIFGWETCETRKNNSSDLKAKEGLQ